MEDRGIRHLLGRLRPYLRPHRGLIGGGTLVILAEVAFRLLEPWPVKFVIDGLTQTPPTVTTATLAIAGAAVVAFGALRAGASYVSTIAFALVGNRVVTGVRADLYRHIQRLPMAFHQKARTGDLLNRLTSDVGRVQEVAVTAALPLAASTLTLAGMAAVMLWMNWQLALLAFVVVPLFVLTGATQSRRIGNVSKDQRKQEGELASVAAESMGAMAVVQAYSLEDMRAGKFAEGNIKSATEGVKGKRLAAGLERRTDVLIALSTGAVLFAGAHQVQEARLTLGELVVFLAYLKSAFKPMRDLAKYTGRIAQAVASGERVMAILDTEPAVKDSADARVAPPFEGHVCFHKVALSHDGRVDVLRAVDLAVPPGTRVALRGASGAGKSSLVSLLLRVNDPTAGRVEIDGLDLRDITLASLRSQVAIVLQESVLFATTIRDNISYGRPDATHTEVENAARLAGAHEFISTLPDGYDTVLSERGSTLSGGQRQRVAIARAALRDAPIIVLDEPTTGLDESNRRTVVDALDRLTEGKTTFFISHDSSFLEPDLVVNLEAGQVTSVESKGRRAC